MQNRFIDRNSNDPAERFGYQRFKQTDRGLVPISDEDFRSGEWVDVTSMSHPPNVRVFLKTREHQTL